MLSLEINTFIERKFMAFSYPIHSCPWGEIYTGIISVYFGDKLVSEKPLGFVVNQIWI